MKLSGRFVTTLVTLHMRPVRTLVIPEFARWAAWPRTRVKKSKINLIYYFLDCFRSCPCYDFCPNGCEGCGNSICTCKSPETDNSHYIQCIHEGTHKLDDCFKTCTANSTCHETCLEDMRRESKMCPCMEDCPLGCPCEGAYDCQNYVTVMCQATSQPSAKDFSYAISTNGLLQNRRYYTSPLTTDSALPKGSQFLYKAGFSLLNGQIYVFGGVQDYQKVRMLSKISIYLIKYIKFYS